MDQLKNCPFCGGGFRINRRGIYEHDIKGCILQGFELHNKNEIEAWNRRTEPNELTISDEFKHLINRMEKEGVPVPQKKKGLFGI